METAQLHIIQHWMEAWYLLSLRLQMKLTLHICHSSKLECLSKAKSLQQHVDYFLFPTTVHPLQTWGIQSWQLAGEHSSS